MKNLNLGSIKVPITAATKAFAVLAKRGAGKTYTAAVLAEEFHDAGIPFVVFDPIDVWWGLRLKADGKSKGLPVVVFGLEHADIQITKDMGRRIAQAIVNENISCVISTFGMGKAAMRHLVAEFADELLRINNTPRHVFIEEAHEFVPQRVMGDAGKCFAAVEALVVMGRNRGIGVTLINQRAATINKDVLTQVDVLLAMRSVGPQDRKALKEWVEFHSAEGDFDAFLTSLPSLPTGEGWLWSPEFMDGVFERVKIRKRETFHVDREKIGSNFKIPKLSQTDIASFVSSFAEPKVSATTVPKAMAGLATTQMAKSYSEADLKKLLSEQTAEYEKEIDSWKRLTDHYQRVHLEATNLYAGSKVPEIYKAKSGKLKVDFLDVAAKALGNVKLVGEVYTHTFVPSLNNKSVHPAGDSEAVVLGKCERKIYSFLFGNSEKSFTKVQVAAVTGYSVKSGGFKNALSRLASANLIARSGDFIQCLELVSLYASDAEEFSAAPEFWAGKLGKCEREIYSYLWDLRSGATKEVIAQATGYSVTSGGFKNALSRLNSLGLILRNPGDIRVNPDLLAVSGV